ncbi:hypothetical protein [Microbacterium sp. 2FI]|uniref:hypothetical protein n=1 Tax=Microbacterium sp. 2FI TaxID=2502193 RepID=UPI0010F6B28D|nr:hypothetical protein [Microbacterium sp. 2FI]
MTRRLGPASGILILLAMSLLASACSAPAPSPETPVAEVTETTAPEEASDCPGPAADSPSGAVDDPFTVDQEIVVECFTVVVDSVEREATDAVVAANPGAGPAEGNVYMTVTVTIARTAGGPADAADVEVILAGSMSTSGEPDPDLVIDPGPPTGTLDEGASTTGTYVYEMSGGASTSVEIRVGTMDVISVLPY